ncbi:ABC transporter permease subunit [Propionibacterium freudenreichii]|uniref:ABC transporter permease n=1 Tax=Propionibacterium freudenreichii TaxID=1744 RepID=UPI00243440B3|nr:ABC transporter permease subunit [Propionibacterium freudenreichii]MDK9321443.1 ABC transporter permease subunit [Propionibacterium freudenreichii]MDK9323841.1 ABC transporter permease subunit [Propionibacterium freudenreichii]WFF32667.1 ABC transporter permease subunit [Propionibacterium freudenreichii]
MSTPSTFIVGRDNRRDASLLADAAVLVVVAALMWALIHMGLRIVAPFDPHAVEQTLDTSPARLPYYAARSLLRMFVALAASLVFAFIYATAAARSRRLSKVLMPLLDVLQSVPILGFLSVTVTFWIALFPHSQLGVECASIFAIFTSQAWNLAFSLHSSLLGQSQELDESARLLRLTRWQRSWNVDLPSGMIPLTWNAMMSFGGGWFFLTASETIVVDNHTYVLPGIGSYVAAASQAQQMPRLFLAIAVMIAMVLVVNFFFWRPITAWAERFRVGDTSNAQTPRSLVLNVLRHSHIADAWSTLWRPIGEFFDRITRIFGIGGVRFVDHGTRRRAGDIAFFAVVGIVCLLGAWQVVGYVQSGPGMGEFGEAFLLGLATLARVVAVLILGTVIWVPVGVWIGMNPRWARLMQPVVQVLASFPANFLFPFFTLFLIATHISLDVGGILLMALGSQWYILFNVIAGASAIPNDLREAATSLQLSRSLRWRTLILPGIFPAWVTGAITAAGGAWNASIVSEIVSYGHDTLQATGLGAYIANATTSGDFHRVLIGVIVMSIYVVGLNRLFWQRLNHVAERRYALT